MIEVRIGARHYAELQAHLLRPDCDEHGALLLAGQHFSPTGALVLVVREAHLLADDEFPPGVHGYRQIAARALARVGNRAADERLALISAHSHPGSKSRTALSRDDLAAHERIFPHLLDITDAHVVCGIAFGEKSAAGEVWHRDGTRATLNRVRVVGTNVEFVTPTPPASARTLDDRFDRQVRLFGDAGQARLRAMHVAVIGAGGGGSILIEQLARLGVGEISVIDFDVVKTHNLSRIMGATSKDARRRRKKVAVAHREIRRIDREIVVNSIDGDIADVETAARLLDCDYLFLATDTATARLVANAIAQSFLIPTIQIGAKVETRADGQIEQIYTAVRPILPRRGCLACANLIDPDQLQREAATPEERDNQNYLGTAEVVDPSVTTLNAAAASGALNAFLMSAVGLAGDELAEHRITLTQDGTVITTNVTARPECRWCGDGSRSRYARADVALLPCRPSPASAERGGRTSRLRSLARR